MNINELRDETQRLAGEMADFNKATAATLSVDDAIRISKVICAASEERLPMILSVFDKAGVYIGGLDELEEWKAFKDQAYIVDLEAFVEALFENGEVYVDRVEYRPEKFNAECKKFNVKPSCAKRALHRKGYLKTAMDGLKLSYTVPVWKDGKAERRVVIWKEAVRNG